MPNLSFKFETPTTKIESFNKLVNGKWYSPESGLLVLSKDIVNKDIKAINKE